MNRLVILSILALFTFSSNGQTKEDFEEFGKLVFNKLIIEEHYNEVSIIWIKPYKELIDNQKGLSPSQKEALKHEVDVHYPDWYQDYEDSYLYFEQSYNQSKLEGAQFEYLETVWTEKKDDELEDTYHFEVIFIFKNETVQNEVTISFDAAWFKGSFFLISEFKENF